MGMSIDECIAYLENVAAEKKPRSRKARRIIEHLKELKRYKECRTRTERDSFYYDQGYKDGRKELVDELMGKLSEEGVVSGQWKKVLFARRRSLMTNRQWAIWQMIDMSEERFAYQYCRFVGCGECPVATRDMPNIRDCMHCLRAWLQQEHEEGGD